MALHRSIERGRSDAAGTAAAISLHLTTRNYMQVVAGAAALD